MEYRFKPGEYERFGRTIVVNDFSMRSDPVTPAKTGPDEIRVLCLGDSVLNGGSQTDHTELATTIWQEKLTAEFGRPVWVGNASAGSWGPGNLLAYTQKFGWFDADVVVILLSSHDAGDVMRFIPVAGSANFPNRKPWLALQEGITRYLPRYLPRASSPASPTPAEPVQPEGADYERDSPNVSLALGKLDELVQSARAGGTRPVLLIQHPERLIELDGPWLPGHAWMADIAKQSGADTLELREALRSDIAQGRTPYQDNIHLNPRGQQVLVDAVWPWLNRAVAHATQVEKQD
ncbi:MAG: GDSL-type esterase/lipase family protein [Planctomycetota bacterium]